MQNSVIYTGKVDIVGPSGVVGRIYQENGQIEITGFNRFGQTGATGADGPTGSTGAKGETGPTGPYNSLIQTVTAEPTGHENKNYSTISFNPSNQTFTIGPTGPSYNVWVAGTQYTKTTSLTTTIPNTSGLYYIYFGSTGALGNQTDFFIWDQQAPTAYVYYNSTYPSEYMLFDERHGITMDWATHEYLHRTRGAQIANGFHTLNYGVTGTGDNITDAEFWVQDGTFFDEDLQIDITNSANPTPDTWQQKLQPATLPVVYREGVTPWRKTVATTPALYMGPTRPYYNSLNAGVWGITEASNNAYIIQWTVATNILNTPVISIMGQNEYTNISKAQEVQWSDLLLGDFPIVEFRPLNKIIFQTSNTYGNAVKSRIVYVEDLRGINQIVGVPNAVGTDGATGPVGATGAKGETGPTGPGGATGMQGPTGPQGSTGPTGAFPTLTGNTGIGVTGSQSSLTIWNQGVIGITGSTGISIVSTGLGTYAISTTNVSGGAGINGEVLYMNYVESTTPTLSPLTSAQLSSITGASLVDLSSISIAPPDNLNTNVSLLSTMPNFSPSQTIVTFTTPIGASSCPVVQFAINKADIPSNNNVLPPGIVTMSIYCKADGINDKDNIGLRFYLLGRNSSGNYTNLGAPSDIVYMYDSTTSQKLEIDLIIANPIDLSDYDVLQVVITSHNRNANGHTALIYFQGNTYSHIHTTFNTAFTGPTGPTGPSGITGPTGAYASITGSTGIGVTGSLSSPTIYNTGVVGITGSTGISIVSGPGFGEYVISSSGGSLTTGPNYLAYSLGSTRGQTGGTGYTLVCDSFSASSGGFTGYNPSTGVFTNNTGKTISLLSEFQLSTNSKGYQVDATILKGNTGYWNSQILAVYDNTCYSQALTLENGETCSFNYLIAGPTGYNLLPNDTKVQFTQLDWATGVKTFVIDHPVDENKYLVHACLEGPEAGVYYRGTGCIEDGNVSTSVQLPDYTSTFTDFTVSVTPIYEGSLRTLNASRVRNGCFVVYGEPGEFDWVVYGKRNSIAVEVNKVDVTLQGDGPYKYLTI